MKIQVADTIIYNANVLTLNEHYPFACGLAITNGKIVALLQEHDHLAIDGVKIDAHSQTILPGLIDAHCHLNAMIAGAFAVYCPPTLHTFEQLIHFIRNQITDIPEGQWIRINKFNPTQFHERRLLTKDELDQISTAHPIRVRHVSRHATMLNSHALILAGIDQHFIAPDGMKIDDQTGILYGADAWLSAHVIQPFSKSQLMQQVPTLQNELLSYGITFVHDATPTTSEVDIKFWEEARQLGWPIHLRFMVSMEYYEQLQHTLQHLNSPITIGAIKVVMESFPELYPTTEQLQEIVNFSFERNIPIAIHAITPEMVWAAVDAISQAPKYSTSTQHLSRLEHVSLCPEAFIPLVANSGLTVVTNPTFIYEHGTRYLADVALDEHNWLYLLKSFHEAGIFVAAGSDAPVASANPFIGMYAACTRTSSSGQSVNEDEKINRLEALKLYTKHAAIVTNTARHKGELSVGYDADFFFTNINPLTCSNEQLLITHATSTWINGHCVYEKC